MKNLLRQTDTHLRRVSAQIAISILAASAAWGQAVNQPTADTGATVATPTNSQTEVESDVIELSPFEV